MQWRVANMGRLDGKIAAVTGGASGIGEATVRRFIAEGASVAFCDRDGERGQRVAAELEITHLVGWHAVHRRRCDDHLERSGFDAATAEDSRTSLSQDG